MLEVKVNWGGGDAGKLTELFVCCWQQSLYTRIPSQFLYITHEALMSVGTIRLAVGHWSPISFVLYLFTGFVLEGFDLPYSKNALGSVISCVTAELPHDKPRFVHALHTPCVCVCVCVCCQSNFWSKLICFLLPADIFTALERGVDVFDSSYCLTAAEKGLALTYHNSLSDALPDTQSTGACGLELDLCQSQYAADFNPILSGCCCYGCSYYSRAYIHHLLSTKELLGQILLMV